MTHLDKACQELSSTGEPSKTLRLYMPALRGEINSGRLDRETVIDDLVAAVAHSNSPQIVEQAHEIILRYLTPPAPTPVEEPSVNPLGILDRDALKDIPPLTPLIDGVVDKGTVTMLTAQPAAGKSFLAIDWAACYSTGKTWQGHTVDNRLTYPDDQPATGKSLYVAAEGARGLSSRVAAWEAAWNTPVPSDRFHVLPRPVQLGSIGQVVSLINTLQEENYGLVVIDTLARCTLGMEENSSSEMGRAIEALYQIREAMGPDGTVLAVHHLGKSGVVRGSSALLGGVDQLMRLERDGDLLTLQDEKRKDGQELAPMSLHLRAMHDSLVIESGVVEHDRPNPLVDLMLNGLKHLLPMSKTELKAASALGDREFYAYLNRGLDAGHITATHEKNPRYTTTSNEGPSPVNGHSYGYSA